MSYTIISLLTHFTLPVFQVQTQSSIKTAHNGHDSIGIIRCHPDPYTDGKTTTKIQHCHTARYDEKLHANVPPGKQGKPTT